MELNLSTSETYELYQGLKRLYALYEDMAKSRMVQLLTPE